MRRIARSVTYGLAGLTGFILILAVAGLITLRTSWFRGEVRARIVYELEKATGGRVELGGFGFQWRTLTAQVRDLVIHGTEGPGEAPLFRVDSVAVRLKILSVLQERVDLESVAMRAPRINLIVYPDGRTNLPTPKIAKQGRGALQVVLDLAIKQFSVTGGTLQAQMRTVPLNMVGQNFRAQLFYEPAPARYRGDIAFRSLDLQVGEGGLVPIDVDAKLVLERGRLLIPSVHLASNGSTVDAGGTVGLVPEIQADFACTVHANLKELPPALALGPLLRHGSLALTGRASVSRALGYAVTAKLDARDLAFRERGTFVENIRVVSAVSAVPGRIEFKDLALSALKGRFDGRADLVKLRDFHVDGELRGLALHEMTRLQGIHRLVWSGEASGPVHLSGAVQRGNAEALHLRAEIGIAAVPGEDPVSGSINLTYDQPSATLSFGPSNLQTKFSRISFSGTLGRQVNAELDTTNLDDARPAIAFFASGPPPEIPVRLVDQGVARFQGVVTGPLKDPAIRGRASITNFVYAGRQFDRAEADVVVSSSGVVARNAALARLGARAAGTAHVGFRDWKAEPSGPIDGSFDVKSPDLADILAAAGVQSPLPASAGNITADLKLSGSLGAPIIEAHAQAVNATFDGQPIDRIDADLRYTASRLDVTSAHLTNAGGQAKLAGRFDHPKDNWSEGTVSFQVSGRDMNLVQLNAVRDRISNVDGHIEAQLAGEFRIGRSGFRPKALNGRVAVHDIAVKGQPLGSLEFTAVTRAARIDLSLDGDLAGSKVTGTAACSLEGNYPANGRLEFTQMQLATLLARLNRTATAAPPPFNGVVAGTLDFSGNVIDAQSWKGSLQLPDIEVHPAPEVAGAANTQDLVLRNAGPILVDIDSRGARLRQAQFRGKDTDLSVGGGVSFGARNPVDVRAQGTVNLALLRDFDKSIYSSGSLLLDISVRGSLENPEAAGRMELRNAFVNVANFPNGIDGANGVLLLYRDRVTIEALTAQSGGGKVAVTGFVSLAGETAFHLRVRADGVRVRYPEGVSSTSDSSLTLTGTLSHSLLAGEVTITRVGFNPRSDLGTILARSSQPVEVPAQPNLFRDGLRFDVHLVTAPEVRFETKLTKDILADANLRLRGDGVRPVLLGRILISQGEVTFFGTKYTINSGQILFVDASKIEPDVSLDLETRTQGIDVTLHVSGPVNKLNVTYRSDPPLPFSDILALLTTGREPATLQGAAGAQFQSGPTQNFQQPSGPAALVSQAIASPITGRLQRFFGVSRLKIDPEVTGLTLSNAAARVTIEQNITSNLTFTYITDVSRAQAQTLQAELSLTSNWSAVAVREENGLFGIDFLYRKQIK